MTEILQVKQPGLLATLQDLGRFGHQAQGVTEGGPMDERAFLWANRLLGNHFNAAQIEITLGQFKAEFHRATLFVVTGAEFPLTLNGAPIKSWRVTQAQAGDTLAIGNNEAGLRCYLAVSGGFIAKPVLGSVATVVRDALGGLHQQGQPLVKGDVLIAKPAHNQTLESRRPSSSVVTALPSRPTLSLIPAGQVQQFSAAARDMLVKQTYRVTEKQDRMGVRLEGQQPLPDVPASMISEPLPIGSVQVPADGQPIVMMNDHQTLGGYPKIGVLSWSARSILAQLPAGRKFQFRWLELAEAQRELRQAWRFFNVMR